MNKDGMVDVDLKWIWIGNEISSEDYPLAPHKGSDDSKLHQRRKMPHELGMRLGSDTDADCNTVLRALYGGGTLGKTNTANGVLKYCLGDTTTLQFLQERAYGSVLPSCRCLSRLLHKKDPMILRCVREVRMSHELDMSLESDAHPDLNAALCGRTFGATSGCRKIV